MTRIALFAVAFAVTLQSIDSLTASEAVGRKQLSDGVLALYQGRNDTAIQQFDSAQQALPGDPRLYFFRGVAKWRQGRQVEAESDFRTGAHIEVALGRIDVGRSLQRIQGTERLRLERFRAEARKLPHDVVMQAVPKSSDHLAARPPLPVRRQQPQSDGQRIQRPAESLAADPSDPFRDGAVGFLGRGEMRTTGAKDEVVAQDPFGLRLSDSPDAGDELGVDGPIGTGVAELAADGDPFAGDAELDTARDDTAAELESGDALLETLDPFSVDDSMAPDAPSAADESPSIFGAAFRALTRGLAPALPRAAQGQKLLQQATGMGAPPSAQAPDDDLFGPPSDDKTMEPADDELGDPFVDE